jgi:predicted enzyme related to lactoylglutathione lyase
MTATATATRIVQVSIDTTDVQSTVRFYEAAFGVAYDASLSSFAFGAYPDDSFFLLTVEQRDEPRLARFGLLVDDVDAGHARALAAGATEVRAPADFAWKPRCSRIADPTGNEVDLYQG